MESRNGVEGVPITADDPRMEIGEDELAWAHEVRAAINNSPNLNNISDYDCAQWAIVTLPRQDLDEVLVRAYKMQCFMQEYKILQSPNKSLVEEGVEFIQGLMTTLPGYLLSLDYISSHGHYVLIVDQSAFYPAKFKTEQDWRTMLGANYFLFQMMNSNLATVRTGVACLIECMDMGFENCSQHVAERYATNTFEFFPMKQKESLWLNTPTAANILISFMRPFLPDELKNSLQMGCKLPGYDEKIDSLFKQPTLEVAQANLLKKIEQYLTETEHHKTTYKLPPLPPQGTSDS